MITLSKTDSYGCVIGNLPYGETTGADMQHNGKFTKYIYYVVECDSAGRVYQKIGDSAYGYNWSQTINGEEEKALDLTYSGSGSDQVVNGAKLTSTVSNELQETEHTLTKIWDDEENYYSTRDRIEVHLWRKLATESDSAFVDLTTQRLPAAVVVSKQFEKAYNESNSTYTDSMTFTHLPKYNENGIEYVYKIKEYSIGTNLVLSMTHIYGNSPDVSSYGTYNYDVKEEEAPSGTVTTITNTLVTRKDNFAIEVAKQWDDNFNQDGKRPSSITYKLTQSYTNDNSETISTDFEQTVTAYGEDGWLHMELSTGVYLGR